MTAKEYLSRPKELEEEIRRNREHLEYLQTLAGDRSPQLSFTGGRSPGPKQDGFEKLMLEIVSLETQIAEKEEQLTQKKQEICSRIFTLPEKHRKVLQKRYLESEKWSDIRKELFLSKTQAYEIHAEALLMIKKDLIRTSTGPVPDLNRTAAR